MDGPYDIEDILKALQVCDEGVIMPQFYAVDLGNIPPVSPDQVDVIVLRGQFHAMQQELCQLKEAVQRLCATPISPNQPPTWAKVAVGQSLQVSSPGQAPVVVPPVISDESQQLLHPAQATSSAGVQQQNVQVGNKSQKPVPPHQALKSNKFNCTMMLMVSP